MRKLWTLLVSWALLAPGLARAGEIMIPLERFTDTTQIQETLDSTGPYAVSATVTDGVAVASVSLKYRVGGTGDFTSVAMTAAGDVYSAAIPGQAVGGKVDYYIEAADASANTATDPADAPGTTYSFYVMVTEALRYDDGSYETGWGSAQPDLYLMERFTPSDFPAYVLDFTYLPYNATAGTTTVQVAIHYDPDGGATPPDAGGIVLLGDPFTPDPASEHTIDLTGYTELADGLPSGTYYVGFHFVAPDNTHPFWLGYDLNTTDQNDRSWMWFAREGWLEMVAAVGQAGVFTMGVTVARP